MLRSAVDPGIPSDFSPSPTGSPRQQAAAVLVVRQSSHGAGVTAPGVTRQPPPTVALEPVTGSAASPALIPRRACRASLTEPLCARIGGTAGPRGAQLFTDGSWALGRGSRSSPASRPTSHPGCADHTTPSGRGSLTVRCRSARSGISPGRPAGSPPCHVLRLVMRCCPFGGCVFPAQRDLG